MKKIFFIVALIAATFVQTSYAQDKIEGTSNILTEYYAVKDALVGGNAAMASTRAIAFVKFATETATITDAARVALVKDASNIANTKDLKKQRAFFNSFSDNMFELAKSTKLSSAPIYKAHCPMAKGSWLSSAVAIKNPYYGSGMLTCGKVVETLK